MEEALLKPRKRHRKQFSKGKEVARDESPGRGDIRPFRIDKILDFDNLLDNEFIVALSLRT